MITLQWHNETFTAEYAVRGFDYVALYDEDYNETKRIINIKGREWQNISLEGEWMPEDEIPTETDRLQADVDYLTMENNSMEETIEQQQADIDYLLMLSEDEEE